jgi:hypothetical protein
MPRSKSLALGGVNRFSGLIYEHRDSFCLLIGWKNNKLDEYVALEKHDQICTQQFN